MDSGDSSSLELSVILIVGGQRERAAEALRSVLEQDAGDALEVLLMDLGPEDAPPLQGSDDPRVRMERSGGSVLYAAARLRATHLARGGAVAFIEEHCLAHPGWARALIEAHRGPWAGVGCAFTNPNAGVGTSSRGFRMTCGSYLPPRAGGETRWIAGQNSSYKRDILLSYGERLETMFMADTVLHWQLQQDGHRLYFEPAARLAHRNESTTRSLMVGIFYWNWSFAGARAKIFRWSALRKAGYIALMPLMPWVRLLKVVSWSARAGRQHLAQCLRDAPFIIAINYSSAAGQVSGLLRGIEIGERAFSHFELNEPRAMRATPG